MLGPSRHAWGHGGVALARFMRRSWHRRLRQNLLFRHFWKQLRPSALSNLKGGVSAGYEEGMETCFAPRSRAAPRLAQRPGHPAVRKPRRNRLFPNIPGLNFLSTGPWPTLHAAAAAAATPLPCRLTRPRNSNYSIARKILESSKRYETDRKRLPAKQPCPSALHSSLPLPHRRMH